MASVECGHYENLSLDEAKKECRAYLKVLEVGDTIQITGRIQSRIYQKKTEEGSVEKTAYEISVSKIEKLNNNTYEEKAITD